MKNQVRILFAKPGLDGHDVGGKVMVRALKDAGFEVFYSGLRKSPQEIIEMVKEKKIDVLGMSILSGSHLPIAKKTQELLKKEDLRQLIWIMGGNIPSKDHEVLKGYGVHAVFSVGSSPQEMIDFINRRYYLVPGAKPTFERISISFS